MLTITTTNALQDACDQLCQSDYVTVDTEFMRERTFWPELCLIQIACDGFECLVDPLSQGLDLAPFFKLMTDESVVKVFHSARQDLEIVHNLGGVIPKPLFDTQVAGMVCGFGDSVAYAGLVRKFIGIELDKSSRFTDWKRRPLTDKQKTYAIGDVTYLRDIYKALKKQLEDTGRSHWLSEEMEILTNPETYIQHPDHAWKRLKGRARKPVNMAVMKEMARWREEEAQDKNQPRGRILKDDAIYDIGNQMPRNEKELGQLRTISAGQARSHKGKIWLDLVEKGRNCKPEDLPVLPKSRKLPASALATIELLKVLLKSISSQNHVAPKLIASAPDLEKLAVDDNADIKCLKGWRHELFGEDALDLKRGKTALTLEDGKVKTVRYEG